jgi:hypothetical protein
MLALMGWVRGLARRMGANPFSYQSFTGFLFGGMRQAQPVQLLDMNHQLTSSPGRSRVPGPRPQEKGKKGKKL